MNISKDDVYTFAVSALVHDKKFASIVLKFRFKSSTLPLLTGWNTHLVNKLNMALAEYHSYLSTNQIKPNPDALENVMYKHAPELTLDEIEWIKPTDLVVDFDEYVTETNMLELLLKFKDKEQCIVLSPDHIEWVLGYIGNTLEAFNNDGTIKYSTGSRH